jgi:hypothetical protein
MRFGRVYATKCTNFKTGITGLQDVTRIYMINLVHLENPVILSKENKSR